LGALPGYVNTRCRAGCHDCRSFRDRDRGSIHGHFDVIAGSGSGLLRCRAASVDCSLCQAANGCQSRGPQALRGLRQMPQHHGRPHRRHDASQIAGKQVGLCFWPYALTIASVTAMLSIRWMHVISKLGSNTRPYSSLTDVHGVKKSALFVATSLPGQRHTRNQRKEKPWQRCTAD
jgi:hypothetical protein